MNGSWQDFLANKILHRPASRTSHLLRHRKISQRGSRTILNAGGSTSAHRWTQAPSDWYCVQRKDVEHFTFLDPLLYPKIVFYRRGQRPYHFSGMSIWLVLIASPVQILSDQFNYCCPSSGQHHDSQLSLFVSSFECKTQQIDCQIIYLPITQRDCTGPQLLNTTRDQKSGAMESSLPQSNPRALSRQRVHRITYLFQDPWTKGTVYWIRAGRLDGNTFQNPRASTIREW